MKETETMRQLDEIDKKILDVLQKEGRISNVDLSKKVGLSPTPCLERVKKLEKEHYILDYVALLNPHKLNVNLLVMLEVTLKKEEGALNNFKNSIYDLEEVLECYLVSGKYDFSLKVRVKDLESYRLFLESKLLKIESVLDVCSYVVMEELKQTHLLTNI